MLAVSAGAVTVKGADVAPAGTVTLAVMPLPRDGDALSVTTAPPLGAAPVRCTAAEIDPPLATVARFRVMDERVIGAGGGIGVAAGVTVTG